MKTQKLIHGQIKAAKMLADGMSCVEVGSALGKDPSTIRRWNMSVDFRTLINEVRVANFGDAANRLASTSFLAACTLEALMVDPDERPEIRLKAATEILGYAIKLSETLDLTQRIAMLERAATIDVEGLDIEANDYVD